MNLGAAAKPILITVCAVGVAGGAFGLLRARVVPDSAPPTPVLAPAAAEEDVPLGRLSVPDVTLVNQRGEPVVLADLLRDKAVAMSFVFTRCATICPPIGASFGRLRRQLGDRAGKDVELVSISIDPEHDTPERLRTWSEKFGAGEGWTLLTGREEDVTRVLKALSVYTAAKEEHQPIVLLGDGRGEWIRSHALSSPDGLLRSLEKLRAKAPLLPAKAPVLPAGAERYFTDAVLVDQEGKERRLYSDLMKGRAVIFQTFFTSCTSSCPVVSSTLAKLQERLGARLGDDVSIVSITLDPENDTPQKLAEYARRLHARRGWYFLTGDPATLETVRHKIGEAARQPDDHSPLLVAGNDRTGLWKKALGLAPADQVLDVLSSVIDDPGERPLR
ncbi:MAG: SCO family protein [Polyangiaceae bacterium]